MRINPFWKRLFKEIVTITFNHYSVSTNNDFTVDGVTIPSSTVRSWLSFKKSLPSMKNFSLLIGMLEKEIKSDATVQHREYKEKIKDMIPVIVKEMLSNKEECEKYCVKLASNIDSDDSKMFFVNILNSIYYSKQDTIPAINKNPSETILLSRDAQPHIQTQDSGLSQSLSAKDVVHHIFRSNRHFYYDAKRDYEAFRFIIGNYHCYCHPTISDEQSNMLTGSLSIKIDKDICRATLTIDTKKKVEDTSEPYKKKYNGIVAISKKRNCVYCILLGKHEGEFVFVSFLYMEPNATYLRCRMTNVLTNAAGKDNYPVVLRMFLSRESLDEKDYGILSPHLRLNDSSIIVRKEDYDKIKESDDYRKVLEHTEALLKPEEFYVIKESFLRGSAEQLSLSRSAMLELITRMRNKSISINHSKASSKVDDTLHDILRAFDYYKSGEANSVTKALVLDFDGTITNSDSSKTTWEALWVLLGYDVEECRKYHAQFVKKEITHSEWCRITQNKFVANGLNKSHLIQVAGEITLMKGVRETFQYCRNLDISIYIVSGSINYIVGKVLDKLCEQINIERIEANKFLFHENDDLKEIVGTKYDFENKATFINEVAKELGIPTRQILFVGNSDNDEYAHISGARTLCINPIPGKTDHTNKTIWHNAIEKCDNFEMIKEYIERTL